MTQIQSINEMLSAYTKANCGHLCVEMREDGRIHMDGFFTTDDLIGIAQIIKGSQTAEDFYLGHLDYTGWHSQRKGNG